MARVTGIGGVFFKSTSDHKHLAAWYRDNLGLTLEEWGGAILKWPDDHAADGGMTVWHVAERESKWFSPSASRGAHRRWSRILSLRRRHDVVPKLAAIGADERAEHRAAKGVDASLTEPFASNQRLQHEPQHCARRM